jgi:hypothetical protein
VKFSWPNLTERKQDASVPRTHIIFYILYLSSSSLLNIHLSESQLGFQSRNEMFAEHFPAMDQPNAIYYVSYIFFSSSLPHRAKRDNPNSKFTNPLSPILLSFHLFSHFIQNP